MSLSANATYRISAPDDRRLLDLLEALSEATEAEFTLHFGTVSLGPFESAEDALTKTQRSWVNSRAITKAEMSNDKITVGFHRAVTQFGQPHTSEASYWEGEVYWYRRNSQALPDAASVLAVADVVDAYRQEVGGGLSAAEPPKALLDVYARQMADLTAIHNKIVLDAEAARLKRQEELSAQQVVNETEAARVRTELANEATKVRERLAAEEAELVARKKEIDDRSHTHARRETRQAITEEIKARQARPAVSRNTNMSRAVLMGLSLVLFLLLAWLAVVSSQELTALIDRKEPLGAPFYTLVGRLALLTVGAVGAAAYLLNFLRQAHDGDLRAERELERYRYDVDRASWVIETVLEAQRRDGEQAPVEIPADWVQGVTRGLFQRSEVRDPDANALAAVGSLFNFAAEAEVGPGGTRLKFKRPGLRALGRQAEADEA
jgi:hypothetical protein